MWNKILLLFFLAACSSHHPDDPLKNTKKLVKEGHASLYQNGAFTVPTTKIKLIPPGPDAVTFAKELTGLRAKESFLKYLGEIKDTTIMVYEGGKSSYRTAGAVDQKIHSTLAGLAPRLRKDSIVIMDKNLALSKNIIGKSWEIGKKLNHEGQNLGTEIIRRTQEVNIKHRKFTALDDFVQGYLKLPQKWEKRGEKVSEVVTFEQFSKNFEKTEEYRSKYSDKTTYLIIDALQDYDEKVGKKLSRVDNELEKSSDIGVTLGVLKSIRWVLDGIVWEGVIRPIGKLTAGAIGYVFVNGVAYPVVLISRQGVTSTHIAVEVLQETGKRVYEIAAPNVEFAIASLLYSGEFLLKEGAEKGTKAAGIVVGNGIKYIAAPVSAVTSTAISATGGVALGVAGGALAGTTLVAAEGIGATARAISLSAAGMTMAGSVTYHVAKGAGELAYEVVKASVVPPGMVLGSGVTLSYGTLTQLSAQTILAASDAAYLVLSMEGPNWVIYAVKGKLGDDDPVAGAVLDLEKMRSQGEEVYKVPISEEEIKGVLDSM